MRYGYGGSRGFTLIELLVVISIIGTLSSVVLASVNAARDKAKDAAIKELAVQMRNVYELEYADKGTYEALMPHTPGGILFVNGYFCVVNDTENKYSCRIEQSKGCQSVYSSNEAIKICEDIFNKTGMYTFGEFNGDFSSSYAIFLAYPSDNSSGVCIRNTGSVIVKTDSATCIDFSKNI